MSELLYRSASVIWDVVDGQTVLCQLDSGELYKLNMSAALIWSLCAGVPFADVVSRLRSAYPGEEQEKLAVDAASLVASLRYMGLLDAVDAPHKLALKGN